MSRGRIFNEDGEFPDGRLGHVVPVLGVNAQCPVLRCVMLWDGLTAETRWSEKFSLGIHSLCTPYMHFHLAREESVGTTQARWGTDYTQKKAGERRTTCGETLAHRDRDLRQIRGNSGIVRGLSGVHFGLFNCDLVLVIAGRYRLESGVWSLRNVLKKVVSLTWPAEHRR